MPETRTRPIALVVAIAAVAALLALSPATAGSKQIFKLEDPRGDDHGDGYLIYPVGGISTTVSKGDLDLVALEARRGSGGTLFEATFAKPVRIPAREAVDDLGTQLSAVARNGFYTFNLDIYIDIDRVPGSGAIRTLPGRVAQVRDPWDRAIVVTPQPHVVRRTLERLMIGSLEQELRADEVDREGRSALRRSLPDGINQRVYFPIRVRVRGCKVSFEVPDSFLGGPAQADWSYAVAVTGSSLVQSLDLGSNIGLAAKTQDNLMVLPVSPGSWQNRFGGGREDGELQPPLVDIIVPATTTQELVLQDFSSAAGRPVWLPGVVPAEPLRLSEAPEEPAERISELADEREAL